jgi:hypothetical protein
MLKILLLVCKRRYLEPHRGSSGNINVTDFSIFLLFAALTKAGSLGKAPPATRSIA